MQGRAEYGHFESRWCRERVAPDRADNAHKTGLRAGTGWSGNGLYRADVPRCATTPRRAMVTCRAVIPCRAVFPRNAVWSFHATRAYRAKPPDLAALPSLSSPSCQAFRHRRCLAFPHRPTKPFVTAAAMPFLTALPSLSSLPLPCLSSLPLPCLSLPPCPALPCQAAVSKNPALPRHYAGQRGSGFPSLSEMMTGQSPSAILAAWVG